MFQECRATIALRTKEDDLKYKSDQEDEKIRHKREDEDYRCNQRREQRDRSEDVSPISTAVPSELTN